MKGGTQRVAPPPPPIGGGGENECREGKKFRVNIACVIKGNGTMHIVL